MKLRNKFLPAMLVFGVVALSSCEKTDQEIADPTFEQGILSHVLVDSAEVTSFSFAQNEIGQVNHYNKATGELERFEKFERNEAGRVSKIITYAGKSSEVLSEEEHTYNTQGRLEQSSTVYFSAGKPTYSTLNTYEYTENNKLKKVAMYEGANGEEAKLQSYTEYAVLPNGNYSQSKQYVADKTEKAKLFSTTNFSYDTNYNPFFEIAEPGTAVSPNNLISSTTEIHNSNKTYAYTYSYKYDERGFPLSQTVSNPNGKTETYNYKYSN
ncbi:hypothetical protein [Pontibacter harenae]|uniref:hypothetical protein n=1 Tax=Pontibacter harenae TaxID=2894083 RepID=UPI001E46F51D|nr:hypothetical protein [Pontibacter harenae]MCC9167660.1 hypothetical protein [Pontibacter harenae]